MKKILLVLTLFLLVVGTAHAKVTFQEFEDKNVIATLNGKDIRLDDIEKARNSGSEHSSGKHGSWGAKLSATIMLKGIIDSRLVVDYALENNYDTSRAEKLFYEGLTLEGYVISLTKDSEANKSGAEQSKLTLDTLYSKAEKLKSSYKIKRNDDLISPDTFKKGVDKNAVVASVNDYNITVLDVILKTSSHIYDREHLEALYSSSLISSLDTLISRAILLLEARKLGFDKNIKKLTEKEKAKLLTNLFNEKLLMSIKNTEEEIKKMYNNNIGYYTRKFRIAKYGIIRKENRAELEKILARIEKGEDFFEVASKESEDKSRENGGVVGFVSMNKIIKKAFNTLKKDEISGIIKEGKSFIVIKRIRSKYDTLDELRSLVDTDIRQAKLKEVTKNKMNELRDAATIIINSKQITEDEFFKYEKKR